MSAKEKNPTVTRNDLADLPPISLLFPNNIFLNWLRARPILLGAAISIILMLIRHFLLPPATGDSLLLTILSHICNVAAPVFSLSGAYVTFEYFIVILPREQEELDLLVRRRVGVLLAGLKVKKVKASPDKVGGQKEEWCAVWEDLPGEKADWTVREM